jgi:trichothecene 3-O-acetyltransferase
MNATGQVIRLFASACGDSSEPFRDAHIAAGNLDASAVFPFLEDGEEPLEHVEMKVPSSLGQPLPTPAEVVPAPWNVFRFTHESIAQLKCEASTYPAEDVAWISTNDAVTAFFWQRLTLARLARFPDVKTCSLIRAFDARRHLKLSSPEGFLGHCIFVCPTTTSVSNLKSASLASLAQDLRRSIYAIDDHYARSLATLLRDTDDRTTISYGAGLKTGLDMLTSSFADLGLQHCEFGPLLGKALFARRPLLDDAEGISYLMPKTIDGDIDLVISLRFDDIEALKKDPVWTRHVEFIG